MIKVCLINPPQKYYEQSQGFSVYFPLGIMYIAAILKKNNDIDVEIFDCLVEDFEIRKKNGFVIYGSPPENIRAAIEKKRPDIVGISVPFTAQFESAKMVSDICREVDSNITVVMGGPDPSVRYRDILEKCVCDFCVIGEGERSFPELVKNIDNQDAIKEIPGLAYQTNDTLHFKSPEYCKNLDDLPFPAYDLIDMKKYIANKYLYKNRSHIHRKSISVITSRGCPYNCVFCSIKLHMGKSFRAHSPEYVLKHLKLLVEKYSITNFHFEDDNISFDKQRFEAILDGIIGDGMKISWDTPNGIRADSIDYNILKKIKRSGCRQLTLAIESGSQRVLDTVIRKKTRLSYTIEIASYCKEIGILANSFYVIGFPGEKLEEIRETTNLALELLRKYDLRPTMLVATPLYGTELYDICMRDGLIEGNPTVEELATATQLYGNPLISTEDFSTQDIKKLIKEYTLQLKKELVKFSFKHPLYAARLIRDKLPAVKRMFTVT